tara:strand:+ start:146 stop:316 length:171 start_codon:yes stop_codon:yes gene_type:complete
MQDFICSSCGVKVDDWVYDDNNIIDNLYYCNDCYNSKNTKIKSYMNFETMEIKQND